MVILTQALGHPKRVGLVKTRRTPDPLTNRQSVREREIAHLDPPARQFLEERRVWDMPSVSIWYVVHPSSLSPKSILQVE
jgi:hypothetical protein